MKNIYLVFFILLSADFSQAQNRFVVLLENKNGTSFSFSNPNAYLSTRAQARRAQASIALDSTDFPVNSNYVAAIQSTGAVVLNTSRWLNSVTVDVSSNPNAINAIIALPFVKQTIVIGRPANGTFTPNKNKFDFEKVNMHAMQSNHQRVASVNSYYNYGSAQNQITMVKGDRLHDLGYRGNGKIIALLDAGYFNADNMIVFDSLRANNRILSTYDFVSHETNVYDDDTHGAMCFSIMGANESGSMVGTAPEASYLLYRSEDAPTENIIEEYNWATAAETADSAGADVISSSLGYTEFDNPVQNHTYADMNGRTAPSSIAANMAARKGMVVVCSAGNSGNDPWHYISAPGDADSILTIGAVDPTENYASFSSTGPSADGRIKPTVAAQGAGTFVANPFNGSIFPGNGTSFSCPVIAGLAACLWQSIPSATNMQIVQAILQSASQYTTPDSLLGYGIPNFDSARTMLLSINNPHYGNGDFLENVFPNPFDQTLYFNFYADGKRTYNTQVFDMSGKLVYQHSGKFIPYLINTINIPAASFSKGLYLLKITTDMAVFNSKVMKK